MRRVRALAQRMVKSGEKSQDVPKGLQCATGGYILTYHLRASYLRAYLLVFFSYEDPDSCEFSRSSRAYTFEEEDGSER